MCYAYTGFIRFPRVRGPYAAVRGAGAAPGHPPSGGLRPGRGPAGRLYPRIPLLGVPGNCDYGSADQPERLTELGGVRILMMHGHTRHVKSGPMAAMYAARECGADILLFGHTHQPVVDRSGDFWVMNPGCIGPSVRRTYGVITLEDGKVDCAAFRL